MKNILPVLLVVVIIGLLTSCNYSNDDNEIEATFTGTIEKINGQMALVKIEEGEILRSGSKVDVDLSVANDGQFQIGDKIKVEYDGEVREKGPLGINTISVELTD